MSTPAPRRRASWQDKIALPAPPATRTVSLVPADPAPPVLQPGASAAPGAVAVLSTVTAVLAAAGIEVPWSLSADSGPHATVLDFPLERVAEVTSHLGDIATSTGTSASVEADAYGAQLILTVAADAGQVPGGAAPQEIPAMLATPTGARQEQESSGIDVAPTSDQGPAVGSDEQPVPRVRQATVWVTPGVREGVRAAMSAGGWSMTQVVLDAFNEQAPNFSSWWARRTAVTGPMPVGRSRKRRGVDNLVQMWLYLTPEQEEILDRAVADSGAGSRSALVTRLLEEHQREHGLVPSVS